MLDRFQGGGTALATVCTPSCNRCQKNFDQTDYVDFTIVGFTTENLLDQLTVDYGKYFKLTVDLYFDCSRNSEYRTCWSPTPLKF